MPMQDVYLMIERIVDYSPVDPDPGALPPIHYRRDCMRNMGHEDGTIPSAEVNARKLTALVYREYLDPTYLVPKPDKIVLADINEPVFSHRVPGTVIYTRPADRLRIHVLNADNMPHSLHVHGLAYGIDSDGSWPFGTRSTDGRRSDEICPGESWTYTFDVTPEMLGAWPFHDHYQHIGDSVNRGLFGGIVVLPTRPKVPPPEFPRPGWVDDLVRELREHPPRPMLGPFGPPGPPAGPPGPHGRGRGHHGGGPGDHPEAHHGTGRGMPEEVAAKLAILEELLHRPRTDIIPGPPDVLHVPLFFHFMSGPRRTPIFRSPTLTTGQTFVQTFAIEGVFDYYCEIHGLPMSGVVRVLAGGPPLQNVTIQDNQFVPGDLTIGPGGAVTWTHAGVNPHTVTERGTASLPTYCLNGRAFVGNTPTVLATAGQRIRWYVFNLDLGMNWHNFHPHGLRWQFGGETIDVRSLGPAESFVVETTAPEVLLVPPEIKEAQDPPRRPRRARPHVIRGDFLVHCHVEMHMMSGMAGLLRSRQTLWLTPEQAAQLEAETGLPIDTGDNACPAVDERCVDAMSGRWEEVPGDPEVTMMHAALMPTTPKVLFWGYGPRPDHSRIWDPGAGYSAPSPQPAGASADENIWSSEHAYLADGKLLVHGGFAWGTGSPNTERLGFIFDHTTEQWSSTGMTDKGRFYASTITLQDGKILTLFGANTMTGVTSSWIEVYDPSAGTWAPPKDLPATFGYFYYPWTYLLPGGELFVAGPQMTSRRFDWTATPIIDDPTKRWDMAIMDSRGVNMDGTSVLLPLRPPNYEPRVIIAGGITPAAEQTAEIIDLSVSAPSWQLLPDMNRRRDKVTAVLLPDGRVMVAGGVLDPEPDGGPVEIFDPADLSAGWELGPSMTYPRDYHSSAILLRDGSVLMGGDPPGPGGPTPHERYLPSYYFRPRPVIGSAPASATYGSTFTIDTPNAPSIAEVVLLRPGAVTHAFNMSQRFVGCSIVSGGATSLDVEAPPDGTIAPPGYYLLFILDGARVPSEGMWIRLTT